MAHNTIIINGRIGSGQRTPFGGEPTGAHPNGLLHARASA